MLCRNRIAQIFVFMRSTTSCTLWASSRCLSKSMEIVDICTDRRFALCYCFMVQSVVDSTVSLWLKFASPIVMFFTKRNFLLSSHLETLYLRSRTSKSSLRPSEPSKYNLLLPKFTNSVQVIKHEVVWSSSVYHAYEEIEYSGNWKNWVFGDIQLKKMTLKKQAAALKLFRPNHTFFINRFLPSFHFCY